MLTLILTERDEKSSGEIKKTDCRSNQGERSRCSSAVFARHFVQDLRRFADQAQAGAAGVERGRPGLGRAARGDGDVLQQLAADNRPVLFAETAGELPHQAVVGRLGFGIGRIAVAAQQAQGEQRAADRAADLPQAADPAAEGGGKAGRGIDLQAGQVTEGAEHRLGTVIALQEQAFGFFSMIHCVLVPIRSFDVFSFEIWS